MMMMTITINDAWFKYPSLSVQGPFGCLCLAGAVIIILLFIEIITITTSSINTIITLFIEIIIITTSSINAIIVSPDFPRPFEVSFLCWVILTPTLNRVYTGIKILKKPSPLTRKKTKLKRDKICIAIMICS